MVWWVQIYSASEWWAHQDKRRGRWSDGPIMPSAYRISLLEQCYDLGFNQLVRSELMTWIYWMIRIFSSLVARTYSKMTVPWLMGLKLWNSGSGSMRRHLHPWIDYHRVQTLTSYRKFWMCWRRQDLGEKLVQLWMWRNVVTLSELIRMMPWSMHAIIKAKAKQNMSVFEFFWPDSVVQRSSI